MNKRNEQYEKDLAAAKAGNMDSDEMLEKHYDHLMDLYGDEMPYGTQKARDGDPYQWLANRLGL
jgi:hypothetical protein